MRIAIITEEILPKSLHGFNVSTFKWNTVNLSVLNLRDYDGVILDLDSYSNTNITNTRKLEVEILNPEIVYDILKTDSSFFITIGDPGLKVKYKTFMEILGFTGTRVKGSGTAHAPSTLAKNSIYLEYLKEIKEYKYAYKDEFEVDEKIIEEMPGFKFDKYAAMPSNLMETKSGHLTAFGLNCFGWNSRSRTGNQSAFAFKSQLVMLPINSKGSKYSIETVLRLLKESGGLKDVPTWVNDFEVHGQKLFDEKIANLSKTIRDLESEREQEEEKRIAIRKPLEMLYMSGKQLEESLKTTLKNSGYEVVEPDKPENVEFYLNYEEKEFVIEVKSTSKSHFNKDGFRQVIEWKANESLDKGKEYKPLLILSNEFSKPLAERNQDVVDPNLIKFSETWGIAVITVKDLYEALQLLSKSKISKSNLIDILYNSNGIVKIDSFEVSASK